MLHDATADSAFGFDVSLAPVSNLFWPRAVVVGAPYQLGFGQPHAGIGMSHLFWR